MNDPTDAEEEAWCDSERTRLIDYLGREGLVHGEIGDWPAWHVWPHVAIWAIESVKDPGWVGWWAISGDLPTDYTTCRPERHPRQGLRDIAERWQETAERWAQNKSVEGWSIGEPEEQADLGPLLAARAKLLLSYAADDSIWED